MSAQRIAPIALSLLLALGLGCHRQKDMQRGQPQYDVVEEGQTTGASSTINAPGEMPPPSTTTADTTTNFTLPTGQTAVTSPNTLGGTLPPTDGSMTPAATGTPVQTPPPARRVLVVPQQQQPYVTPSEGIRWSRTRTTTAPGQTTTRPPESEGERTSTEPPPDSSDTAASSNTSTTANATATSKPKDATKSKQKTDTSAKTDTQAPPPTTTDTRGN